MKNKNPWKLLRCIGIAPWKIFTGEQRFIFGGRDGGPDTPDGGTAGESENAGAEAEDADDAGELPANTETTIQAGTRLVEAGQRRLPKSAESSYEDATQAVERFVSSLTADQREDREISNVIDKALDELRRGQWIDLSADRKDILDQMRADVAEIIGAQTPAATADENAPPPAGEGEEGEEESEAEVLPPTAATEDGAGEAPAAHAEAVPKRPRLGDKERIARAIKIGKVNRDKIVKALDISDADKTVDAKLVAAVRKFQQELWETATPEDKAKFKARYRNAKGFGDGIWGEDTQALFDVVAKYADGKDGGFKEKLAKLNPAATPPVAPAAAEAAPAAPPPAAAEAAAPLPSLPTVSRPTFRNSAELKDSSDYKSPDKYDEYTAQVGDILVLDTDIKDADGNTIFKEGLPVMVTAIGERKEDKNITLEVATAKGEPIKLADGKTRLSAADQLDNPDAEDIQEFVRQKNTHAQALWEKGRLDDVDNMYRREVVFTTDATDDNGKKVAAGTTGMSQWTPKNGYTVTVGENVYRFKGVEVGRLPVKDKSFDSATGQYAKLRTGGKIFIYHRGEKSGASMPIPVRDGEVVLVLGKTNDGYKIRTSWGGEGFITNASLNEGTRVARTAGQPIEAVLAAVEAKKAAPPAAVAAAPTPAPPPAPVAAPAPPPSSPPTPAV